MKFSRFNNLKKTEIGFEIFNALTNKKVEILNGFDSNRIKDVTELDKFIDAGILIDEDLDEDKLAQQKYFDYIYENILDVCLIPSMECNFRCAYCYEEHKPKTMTSVDYEILKKFFQREIKNFKGLKISWFGGEPLLQLNNIIQFQKEIISICKEHKKPLISTMTTNGYLLSKENFQKCLKAKINIFQITIDGTAENHNTLRPLKSGAGSYKKIIENLKNIRDSFNNSYKIVIRTNLAKTNIQNLDQIIDEYNRLFGNRNEFQFYFAWVQNHDNCADNLTIPKNSDILHKIYESNLNIERALQWPFSNFLLCDSAKKYHYVIDTDLNLKKCTIALNDDKNIIGNLDSDGKKHINTRKESYWLMPKKYDCSLYASCFNKVCPLNNSCDNCQLKK